MQEVQAICNRVIIINKGQLVADDTTKNLQQRIQSALVLTVEFDKELPVKKMKKLEGIQDINSLEGHKYNIKYDAEVDIRPKVFEFAVQHNLKLLNMQQEEQSLEEVFQQLTQPQD
jgi:ABC-2 type transport system ATP-binding protein